MLLLLLGLLALSAPSLQLAEVKLGKGAACGGWESGRCDTSLNLTCVTTPGSPPGDEFSDATGVCVVGPAPGCAPCSSVVCPPRPWMCRGRSGRSLTEPCGCCVQCPRQDGELCGGPHWEKGYCDRDLTCALIVGLGPALPPNTGVCKELPGINRDYLRDPLCPWVWGCDRRAGTCGCYNLQSCHNMHRYDDFESCEEILRAEYTWTQPSPEEEEEERNRPCTRWGCEAREDRCECLTTSCSSRTHLMSKLECEEYVEKARCSNTSCPDVRIPSCPSDSFLTQLYTPPRQCCPTVTPVCTCNLKHCPLAPPSCPPGQQARLMKKGDGHPGSCCDQYQCVEGGLEQREEKTTEDS